MCRLHGGRTLPAMSAGSLGLEAGIVERSGRSRAARVVDARDVMRELAQREGVLGLPAGTVTFLLTDIEGSTRLWEAEPAAMATGVPRHYELIASAGESHRGGRAIEQGEGDSTVAAFARASDALAAAVEAQRALLAEDWPGGVRPRVRMALHTAEAQLRDAANYQGVALSRCARLREIANGGQILLS